LKEGFENFSRNNWRSTIRSTVKVHNKYGDLEDLPGKEIADIVYVDYDGHLTRFLRERCVNDFPLPESFVPSASAPVEYLIEVKTTTQDWNTRFFMSTHQYDRVSSCRDMLASTQVVVLYSYKIS
jgi:hypothetical protein